jgi:hypothetical protein
VALESQRARGERAAAGRRERERSSGRRVRERERGGPWGCGRGFSQKYLAGELCKNNRN